MEKAFTQRYKTYHTKDGYRFTFYCDLCETYYETEEIISDSFSEALQKGQNEAKFYFNKCHECGKWICDEHYNEDVMKCIECSRPSTRRESMRHKEKEKGSLILRNLCRHHICKTDPDKREN
jgi:hypothetical protein